MSRRVRYNTEHGTVGSGIVADEMQSSPLTGKPRILIVDFHSEARDPDAGHWIDADRCLPEEEESQ